jgi:transposase
MVERVSRRSYKEGRADIVKVIDEATKIKVVELYEQGLSVRKIADSLNLSVSTIQRIIKELPESSQEAHTLNQTNKRQLSSLMLKYKQSITQQDLTIQDEKEGWIVDVAKLKAELEEESQYWICICYPESSDINEIMRKIKNKGIRAAISPLHNKDKWLHDSPQLVDKETGEILDTGGQRYKQGDTKKAHYHIIFQFEKVMPFRKVLFLMELCNTKVYPKRVFSPLMMYEYLWHKNEDLSKKAHYSKEDVVIINGFVPLLTKADKDILMQDILKRITLENLTTMEDLLCYYNHSLEVIQAIKSSPYLVQKNLDSVYQRLNPSKDRIHKVQIVKEVIDYGSSEEE